MNQQVTRFDVRLFPTICEWITTNCESFPPNCEDVPPDLPNDARHRPCCNRFRCAIAQNLQLSEKVLARIVRGWPLRACVTGKVLTDLGLFLSPHTGMYSHLYAERSRGPSNDVLTRDDMPSKV